ncbi:hypothetical protein Agabi119p4_7808 [Agaricus bisporus var. burnettii]|uniref:Peptidase M43 pregnancy-associated plasma-A domain-containing protein n=1 Tax=Agaricus bisporus var. burnettii TaxID=192524 RepID=A0A8H7C8Y5_AGABI|nr:hypothetical protein Agabi119p4_7808 [Agaricus bisporus var. burnettii]
MLLIPFAAAALLFGTLSGAIESQTLAKDFRRCGTLISQSKLDDVERKFNDFRLDSSFEAKLAGSIHIDVHFHIVYENTTLEGGYIPDQQIKDQMDVLNADYGLTGLRWRHTNTTRTKNREWFDRVAQHNEHENNMKLALKTGDATTLNVYSVGFRAGEGIGLLGFSTFPWDYNNNSSMDGVVVLYSSLPRGTLAPYNKGRKLTHEVGHWLGLYHTFQGGGCGGNGDFVSDTPTESSPAYGCPTKRDSCPDDPGLDPIHNFMDYSEDACMREFTKGQISRIKAQISAYRGLRKY